jgi:hypothetical protein
VRLSPANDKMFRLNVRELGHPPLSSVRSICSTLPRRDFDFALLQLRSLCWRSLADSFNPRTATHDTFIGVWSAVTITI